jgi:Ca-activated chloride channel family protein
VIETSAVLAAAPPLGLQFVHPELAPVLLASLALWALLAYLELRQPRQLSRFLSAVMQLRLAQRLSRGRRLLRLCLLLLALGSGSLALLRPQTPGELETVSSTQVSADVMVVLDVSRSMLAEDAAPSRLLRAKAEIYDLLSKLKGHRVGLVAFAGRAQVLCPLTPDYGFFRVVLERTDPRSVGRGGTRIGDGLRTALDAFGQGGSSARLILLITDGEDMDSYPVEAAKEVRKAGVRVVAIGFGDERGSEITLTDPTTGARSLLVDRQGQVVRSRLDGKTLREIALATDGAYIPAGVAALDLESIIKEHIQPLFRDQKTAAVRSIPKEYYPWLILLTLLALVAAVRVGRSTAVAAFAGEEGSGS